MGNYCYRPLFTFKSSLTVKALVQNAGLKMFDLCFRERFGEFRFGQVGVDVQDRLQARREPLQQLTHRLSQRRRVAGRQPEPGPAAAAAAPSAELI